MQTVSEQVTQEIHQGLKSMGLAPLTSDNTASLIAQFQNIAKKENCVRNVIGECATCGQCGCWREGPQPWVWASFQVPVKDEMVLRRSAHRNPVHPTQLSHSGVSPCDIHTHPPARSQLAWFRDISLQYRPQPHLEESVEDVFSNVKS